jgi:hypothetical protein
VPRSGVHILLAKMVLYSVAKQKLVAENFFIGGKDGLARNVTIWDRLGTSKPTAADAGDAFTISLSAEFNICVRAGCYCTVTVKLNVAACESAPLVPVITME